MKEAFYFELLSSKIEYLRIIHKADAENKNLDLDFSGGDINILFRDSDEEFLKDKIIMTRCDVSIPVNDILFEVVLVCGLRSHEDVNLSREELIDKYYTNIIKHPLYKISLIISRFFEDTIGTPFIINLYDKYVELNNLEK